MDLSIWRRSMISIDHGDEIAIATLYLLAMMIMAVLIRLAFRYYMLRSLQWDDGMVSLALILSIAQSSVILSGTQHGLGKRQFAMTDGQYTIVQKDLYASDLLYVLSLSLAKTSVLRFLQKICVLKPHKKICSWSIILIAVWTVPVFFTLAFQCGASRPWNKNNGHCINMFAFWVAICPVDIITELVICILPGFVIKPVQVASGKKFTVVIAFVFRIFVVITTIVRLAFIKKTQSLADMNTNSFATVITTQTNLCVSLMTACIPCLKPFLDAFDSGMLNVSLHKRAGGGYSSSSGAGNGNSYALASLSRGTKESSNRSRYADDDIEGLGTSAAAFAVTAPSAGRLLDLDGDANGSTMAIQRTDQWSVRCEYVDQKDSRPIGDDAEISEVRENNGDHVSL